MPHSEQKEHTSIVNIFVIISRDQILKTNFGSKRAKFLDIIRELKFGSILKMSLYDMLI